MNIGALTKKLANNRQNGTTARAEAYPLGDEQPYDIQAMVAGYFSPLTAWKAGGTNKKTQEYFAVTQAYFGPIPSQFVCTGENIELDSRTIHSPLKGEAEVCFCLNEMVQVLNSQSTKQEILSSIGSVHLCLELPWTQFSQPSSGLDYLIADMCGANALLLGPGMPFSQWSESSDRFILSTKGNVLTDGNVLDSIIKPLDCYFEFITFCLRYGITLRSDMYIATGGVTACVELPMHSTIDLCSDVLPNFSVNII